MLITVKDYSIKFKISRQAVYKKIEWGELKAVKNADGITAIEIEQDDNHKFTADQEAQR